MVKPTLLISRRLSDTANCTFCGDQEFESDSSTSYATLLRQSSKIYHQDGACSDEMWKYGINRTEDLLDRIGSRYVGHPLFGSSLNQYLAD